MAKRSKLMSIPPRYQIFLRNWREFRGLNLDRMAQAIAAHPEISGTITIASLSRIETGLQPYSRDTLEVYAAVLDCHPADLLQRPPADPEGIWRIWHRLRQAEPRLAARVRAGFIAGRDDDDEPTSLSPQGEPCALPTSSPISGRRVAQPAS